MSMGLERYCSLLDQMSQLQVTDESEMSHAELLTKLQSKVN